MNAARPNASTTPEEQIVQDAKEAHAQLVRDVLASRTFAKSARLSELLSYICRTTLNGEATQLNEQQIGIRVFGRSPSYNPADDSIVRAQARLLRQKLEEYFDHECTHTAEIITVPKGGYVPLFRPREAAAPAEEPAAAVPRDTVAATPPVPAAKVAAPAGGVRLRMLRWVLPLAALVGVGLLLWQLRAHSQPAASGGADVLWRSLFERNQPTLIVASDDGLVLFQELTRSSVSLSDYLDGSYLRRETRSPSGGLTFDPAWFAAHQYTSIADLDLTLRLSRVPQAAAAQVLARDARGLRLDDLKAQNVILIGGPGSNPLVSLFSDRLNFQLGWDWSSGEGFVRNTHPLQEEQALYHDALQGSTRKSYGLLAFLPGIDGNRRALLVEGTGMAGTEAAADFLFGTAFEGFAKSLGEKQDGLPYFELLLETTSIGGNAPQSHIVAYRRVGQ